METKMETNQVATSPQAVSLEVCPDTLVTEVGIQLLRLHEVDAAKNQFQASIRIHYKFPVPDLPSRQVYKVAKPRTYYERSALEDYLPGQAIEMLNATTFNKTLIEYYGYPADELIFHVDGDDANMCRSEVRVDGTFHYVFQLRRFPFDKNCLPIRIRHWRKNDADHKRDWFGKAPAITYNKDSLEFPDYKVLFDDINQEMKFEPGTPADVTLSVPLQRLPWFYTQAVTGSYTLIMLASLTSMYLDVNEKAERLNFVVTLLLATVATKFVVAADLPRVPYMTCLDIEYFLALIQLLAIMWITLFVKTEKGHNASFFFVVLLDLLILGTYAYFPVRYLMGRL